MVTIQSRTLSIRSPHCAWYFCPQELHRNYTSLHFTSLYAISAFPICVIFTSCSYFFNHSSAPFVFKFFVFPTQLWVLCINDMFFFQSPGSSGNRVPLSRVPDLPDTEGSGDDFDSRCHGNSQQAHATEPIVMSSADSCEDLFGSGMDSGVYRLQDCELNSAGRDFYTRYCDMRTDGGGWTVSALMARSTRKWFIPSVLTF